MDKKPRDGVPLLTLSRGLGILELLAGAPPDGISHASLAGALGFQRSTLYRYLASLEELGFVEALGDGHYRLGARASGLSTTDTRQRAFRRLAPRAVQIASALVGETIHATVFVEGYSMTVMAPTMSSSLSPHLGVGTRRPAHLSASGKVFLASLPARVVEPFIEAADGQRKRHAELSLREELAAVRELGFAMDEFDLLPGVTCVAVPVFDYSNEVVGSLSLAMATGSSRSLHLRRSVPPLLQGARSFSKLLGFD